MIQFNLLPDVKLEYIKTRRLKRSVILIAGGAAIASLAVLVALFLGVSVFQKKHLDDLSRDIKRDSATLQAKPDINKIITIQNQLNTLTTLHDAKPVASRLFGFVQQVTPADATIATFAIDFTTQQVTLTGAAKSIGVINQFTDTLKFTNFLVDDQTTSDAKAFSTVVLTSFGRDDKGASYTITMKYAPELFKSDKNVKLAVPNIVTTRSETEKPGALFQPLSNTTVPATTTTTGQGR